MNWRADTSALVLKKCQETDVCLGPGAHCRRRERCYQSLSVKQSSGLWFWYCTCCAVSGQQKDVSRNKTQARIPVGLLFLFLKFLPVRAVKIQHLSFFYFIVIVVITKLFHYYLLFYRGFSQHAVPLDLSVITNHILLIQLLFPYLLPACKYFILSSCSFFFYF